MYYQEKVIHGILCHRTTPNGQWHEFTKAELTDRIVKLKNKQNQYIEKQVLPKIVES